MLQLNQILVVISSLFIILYTFKFVFCLMNIMALPLKGITKFKKYWFLICFFSIVHTFSHRWCNSVSRWHRRAPGPRQWHCTTQAWGPHRPRPSLHSACPRTSLSGLAWGSRWPRTKCPCTSTASWLEPPLSPESHPCSTSTPTPPSTSARRDLSSASLLTWVHNQ